MNIYNPFMNKALIAALLAWAIAQAIKVPLEYLHTKRWNWSLLLRAGGMPSSHSALVSGLAIALGLFWGFASPLFAIAFVICMVVIYDATGIRRQAGRHARVINQMVDDLVSGHPLKGEQLIEVLGHSPKEVMGGIALGLASAVGIWLFWR